MVGGMACAQSGGVDVKPVSPGGNTPPAVSSGPQLSPGEVKPGVDGSLSPEQKKELLASEDEIFKFASKDTGLPIQHAVKTVFVTRQAVHDDLRKKFDEDKGAKRMERSELVMKKFGMLDQDFKLKPFLLSLLTEQIEGFYDSKKKTMNLLDWGPRLKSRSR